MTSPVIGHVERTPWRLMDDHSGWRPKLAGLPGPSDVGQESLGWPPTGLLCRDRDLPWLAVPRQFVGHELWLWLALWCPVAEHCRLRFAAGPRCPGCRSLKLHRLRERSHR